MGYCLRWCIDPSAMGAARTSAGVEYFADLSFALGGHQDAAESSLVAVGRAGRGRRAP